LPDEGRLDAIRSFSTGISEKFAERLTDSITGSDAILLCCLRLVAARLYRIVARNPEFFRINDAQKS